MIGIYHIVNNGRKNISPFWKLNDLYLKKIKSRQPRMHYAMFIWNWPSPSWEDFWISSANISWLSSRPIIRAKFNQGCFVQCLVENGSLVLEKILNFINFVIISPWKKTWLFIWRNLNLFYPKDALCQVWLKLAQ